MFNLDKLFGRNKKVLDIQYEEVSGEFYETANYEGTLVCYNINGDHLEMEVTYVGYLYELDLILFRCAKSGKVYGCINCIIVCEAKVVNGKTS